MIMISMVFLTIAEAIMSRSTTNIIARLMEISIHRTTIIRKVARTPQEGSDQDVKIWWVSKITTFDLNLYFLVYDDDKLDTLVYQKFCFPFG